MRFFLNPPVPVSCEYGVPRPTAEGIHTGRDYAVSEGTPILAPADGLLHLQYLRQHGDYKPDLLWPDGGWWPYSRYYEWWAGCLAILFCRDWTHVWLHIDPWYCVSHWEASGRMYRQPKLRKAEDYTQYVIPWINWLPIRVLEGDLVAVSGVSGYDTAPHVHYQLMRPGRQTHQHIHPKEAWG